MSTPSPDAWRLIEEKTIRECIPVKGIVEVCWTCNFACVYCYLGEKRKDASRLAPGEWRKIFRSFRDAGTLVLTFTGGEPFLYPGFLSLLEEARAARLAVRVFTNGSLVGREEARRLKAVRPLSVDVSLYGMSEETYAAVTGGAHHFEMTMQGLEHLAAHGLPVVIKVVVNRLNRHEVPRMREWAREMGFDAVLTPLITPTDCGDTSPCAYMLEDEELARYFAEYGSKPRRLERRRDDIPCTSGRNGFVVSPVGEVYPCIQIRVPVGNVRDRSFADIWLDHPAPLLRRIRDLRFGDFTGCVSCPHAPFCFFCPGLALLESGSLTGKNLTACRFTAIRRSVFGV